MKVPHLLFFRTITPRQVNIDQDVPIGPNALWYAKIFIMIKFYSSVDPIFSTSKSNLLEMLAVSCKSYDFDIIAGFG